MNEDDIFRLTLIVGLIAVLPVAIFHRVNAHWSGEKLDRRQEGCSSSSPSGSWE